MWRTLAKLAVSVALIAILFRNQNIGSVFTQILRIDPAALGLAIVALALIPPTLALRWSVILRAMATPRDFRTTFPLTMIGQFFNQALPSAVGGDVVRIWLLSKTGIATSAVISGVLIDRILGVLALLVIVTMELPWLLAIFSGNPFVHGILALLIVCYGGFAVSLVLDRVPQSLMQFRAVRGFAQISRDLRRTLAAVRFTVPALGYGVINQLLSALAAFALATGLGLPIRFAAFLWLMPLANLVQTVPVSIGGWGIREGFFVTALGMTGLAGQGDALALSVLYGLLNVLVSLPGAPIWLMQRRVGQERTVLVRQPLPEPGRDG